MELRGDLEIIIRESDSRREIKRFLKRNTITYNGLNSALYLWSQEGITAADFRFTKLVPGTNASPPSRGNLAVGAALPLADHVVLGAGDRVVAPTVGELVVTGTLTSGQGNCYNICEIGLLLANGQLFARQVHPVFAKTIAFTVGYTWRFRVTTTS